MGNSRSLTHTQTTLILLQDQLRTQSSHNIIFTFYLKPNNTPPTAPSTSFISFNKSIPLTDVVNSFKIMVTHKHGAQGQMDTASKASLENEFGTKNEDEVIIKILEQGQPQSVQSSERGGDRNETMGPRQGHPTA